MAAMGALIEAETRGVDVDAVQVWSTNWPTLMAFLDCETQWRVTSTMAGLIWHGLDYSAVDVVLRRTGADDDVFAKLRAMETAALAVFGEHG